MWEKTCLVCDSISTTTTFTTGAYQETFKIQKDPLKCDSEKKAIPIEMQSLWWIPLR